jgi:hypothetical protein
VGQALAIRSQKVRGLPGLSIETWGTRPSSENAIVQGIIEYTPQINYAFCGFAIEAVVHDLNELVEGKGNAGASLVDAFGALTGCVGSRLGQLIDQE